MPKILKNLLFLSLALSFSAHAETDEEYLVGLSEEVFRDILSIPERSIPPGLLSQAQAIAIIPETLSAGIIVGGRYGKGLIMVKDRNTGSWSAPAFIKLMGGNVGLQVGAQSTDIILVFKNKRGLNSLVNGKFTLGADASVAAGPVGRNAAAATDIKLQAEILSYSRSRGLFVGISLGGTSLKLDQAANESFYHKDDVTPRQIFSNQVLAPLAAQPLRNTLRAHVQ